MTTSLESLERIREMRETNARARVQQCRAHVIRNIERYRRRKRNIEKYRIWRVRQESKLFSKLQNNPATLRTLDDFRLRIDEFRHREMALNNQIQKAKNSLRTARKDLMFARKAYFQAMKAYEKLKEYSTTENEKAACCKLRNEEIELEELVALNPVLRF